MKPEYLAVLIARFKYALRDSGTWFRSEGEELLVVEYVRGVLASPDPSALITQQECDEWMARIAREREESAEQSRQAYEEARRKNAARREQESEAA